MSNRHRHASAWFGFPSLFAAFLFLAAGCGPSQVPVYPVKGQVVSGKDKTPAKGAVVAFHPTDQTNTHKPVGTVDADGKFKLTTRKEGDGAPAGDYAVTVQWFPEKTPIHPDPVDKLKGKYADPKKSDIKFTVKPGNNDVPEIALP